MVWVTWRQHRVQVLASVAFVVVVGVLLLVHGIRTDALVTSLGPARRQDALGAQFGLVARLLIWSVVPPMLIGLFWGAPLLAREYERGTHWLAWTQSVSRPAWLGVKLVGLGAVVTAAGLVFGLSMYAWADEFGSLPTGGRLGNPDLFLATGIVPAAWWLFAFMLGVATGAVLRKLMSAVAVTLAVFFLVYVGMSGSDLRLSYAAPMRVVEAAPVVRGEPSSINTPAGAQGHLPAGALLAGAGWLDSHGTPLSDDETWTCGNPSDYLPCMRDKGYSWFADYHPADRYWRFQWTEAGLLFTATLVLGAVVWRRTR
jgi:hypothetical protein